MSSSRPILAVLFALAPVAARSQTAPAPFPGDQAVLFRDDAAGTRPHLGYDLTGIALGPFQAYPSLTMSAGGDSNVFNRPDARGDVVGVVQPALRVASDWGRHAIELDAFGRFSRFARLTEQDSDEYSVRGSGRYDIAAHSYIALDASYGRLAEPRGSAGLNFDGGTPSVFRQTKADLGGSTEFGAMRASATVAVETRRYEPITLPDRSTFDQRFRDTRSIVVAPRLDYALSGLIGVFVSGAYTSFTSTRPLDCCRRDAVGGLALGGVHVALDDIVVGEAAIGWRARDFDLARYRDYSGVAVYAKLDWYPTELVSVRLAADQDFENSGITQVAGILARQFSLTGYYELVRNINLTASALYLNEKYRGLGVNTDTVRIAFGGEYLLNKALGLGLNLSYRDRAASAGAIIPAYHGFQGNVSVTVRNSLLSGRDGPAIAPASSTL